MEASRTGPVGAMWHLCRRRSGSTVRRQRGLAPDALPPERRRNQRDPFRASSGDGAGASARRHRRRLGRPRTRRGGSSPTARGPRIHGRLERPPWHVWRPPGLERASRGPASRGRGRGRHRRCSAASPALASEDVRPRPRVVAGDDAGPGSRLPAGKRGVPLLHCQVPLAVYCSESTTSRGSPGRRTIPRSGRVAFHR